MGQRGCWLRLLPLLVCAIFLGCGPKTGSVSGKVTYKGKPVTGGGIVFHGENNQVAQGIIDAEGNYVVPLAPVGPVKITVQTSKPRDPPKPKGKDSQGKALPSKTGIDSPAEAPAAGPGKYVKIPDKYKDKDKSGLEFTVKPGKQEFDIDLKD